MSVLFPLLTTILYFVSMSFHVISFRSYCAYFLLSLFPISHFLFFYFLFFFSPLAPQLVMHANVFFLG